MNDKAVYRTAPATPGLLNIGWRQKGSLCIRPKMPNICQCQQRPSSICKLVCLIHLSLFPKKWQKIQENLKQNIQSKKLDWGT